MTMKTFRRYLIAFTVLTLLAAPASAATVSIVAPSSVNGSVHFPADIHFNITSSSSSVFLILKDYVISDGHNNLSNPVVNDVMISKNGATPTIASAIFF